MSADDRPQGVSIDEQPHGRHAPSMSERLLIYSGTAAPAN
jgi:hypothetical protein